jgi:Response regulator containing a CheY-like receiver domain and an HTH DNA-binding domain
MKKTNLIIVDDHRLFRNGIKALLKELDYIGEVAEASNGKEFLEYVASNETDIALMDINMPVMNGIDATREAAQKHPDLKIIALSMLNDEDYYFKMIEAGAKGFILKDSGSEDLTSAIETVLNGQSYFSQELLRNIIISLSNNTKSEPEPLPDEVKFTDREIEVLEQICKGLSNQEIADTLCISSRTVERHRANIFEKTGSKNSVNLVMYAIKNNLVKI